MKRAVKHIDKDNREKRECAVRDLWFACATQEQIAEAVGMPRTTIEGILTESEKFRFPSKPGDLYEIEDEKARLDAIEKRNREAAFHETEFAVPIYNIWKQKEKTGAAANVALPPQV
jgi:hypothetical protein